MCCVWWLPCILDVVVGFVDLRDTVRSVVRIYVTFVSLDMRAVTLRGVALIFLILTAVNLAVHITNHKRIVEHAWVGTVFDYNSCNNHPRTPHEAWDRTFHQLTPGTPFLLPAMPA